MSTTGRAVGRSPYPGVPAVPDGRRTAAATPGTPSRPRRDRRHEGTVGEVRWVGGTSGPSPSERRQRGEFPRSPVSAWATVVTHHPREQQPITGDADDEVGDERVEGNARLTGTTAAALLVLFAAEGVTVLRVRSLLTAHVVIGMVLLPPVLLKVGSTLWRFGHYYLGSPDYRRKGPPPPLMRLLGPFVVVLTLVVIGSGIALLVGPVSARAGLLRLHQVSFVLWFGAMTVHVLAHLADTARLAPKDLYRRTRGQVRGARARQWVLVTALSGGIVLAAVTAPSVEPWLAGGSGAHVVPGAPAATTHTTARLRGGG